MVCLNGARVLMAKMSSVATALPAIVCQDETATKSKNTKLDTLQIFHEPVPRDVTAKTLKLAKELGHVTNYYVGDQIYANATNEYHFKATGAYAALCGVRCVYCNDDYQGAMDIGLPSKLLVFCCTTLVDDLYAKLSEALDGKAHIMRGSPARFVEVLNKNVSKGRGLQLLCDYLGVEAEESVAFGDGDNDKKMFEWAGKGIAMKNARDAVRAVADEVTKWTNAEVGLAHVCDRGVLAAVDSY